MICADVVNDSASPGRVMAGALEVGCVMRAVYQARQYKIR